MLVECNTLCQRSAVPQSLFRKIPVAQMGEFDWKRCMDELAVKCQSLLQILTKIACHSDHRNKKKIDTVHYPSICMAAAVILKERNREMCGLQSLTSLLLFASRVEKQVYSRLNHISVCVSYSATLRLVGEVSQLFTIPLQKWIAEDIIFKFWGDNLDKKRGVRDVRSDRQGAMVHMYSLLAGRSRTPAIEPSRTGNVADLTSLPSDSFLPKTADIQCVKKNLVVIVSRILTHYIRDLSPLSKCIPKHILHKYSNQMACKSEVVVLDVLMKNESKHTDMLDIMLKMQEYLGPNYSAERRVASGGDQLTCERQVGAQRRMMDGNTQEERLQLLEPVTEDWHCLCALIKPCVDE